MSMSSIPLPEAAIVTRLRSAGCVFAEDEARLLLAEGRSPADLRAMLDRRVSGVPLEQVVGWAEFCGLRITIEPGVFVPRRRTEFLVRQAAALVRQTTGPVAASEVVGDAAALGDAAGSGAARRVPVVVDMCCGSGAVGAALAAAAGPLDLHAVDIDPAAVRCARRNVVAAGGRVYEGDLFAPLPSSLLGRVDLLVANAPYVPTEMIGLMPPEARDYEARVALDGGRDGLEVQRQMIADAPRWLAPGGRLLVETSDAQGLRTAEIVASSGLIAMVRRCDDLDATVVIGARPTGD